MIVVLLGPPGSGKGTQAKKMVTSRHWPQLSTGDMLRAAIAEGTKLGLEAKSYMDKGALVPDSVVIGLIRERNQAPDCAQGFVLDGFPRNLAQAQELDRMLGSQGRQVDRAVLFEIPDGELVKRLGGRRTCPKCNSMFHLDSARSRVEGICDQCGTALVQRDDDREQVILNRLKVYKEQTSPLAGYYDNQKKLKRIDAGRPPADVARSLDQALAR